MAARVTAVYVELVAHEPGHWCARCMLPSGWRAWVAVRSGDRMHLQTRLWCDECDSGAFVHVDDDHPRT